ncbi:MAG: hypothetical protein FI718_01300 [SAR202 cluster bacterium]|nr:hypothetical protein [Chloroflexota bacterium]MQG38617.1 hypothetical protein [SAR202 cluster bacterium]|tara:strand:- start:2199 stop:3176 length:978 start_codon:yes stop_codon:yes gene_type:complete
MKSELFKQGREKGVLYLLNQLSPNGQFGNPEAGVTDYYKVPSALQVSGRSQSANMLIDWIRKNGFEPNGDFGPRPKGDTPYYYLYFNSWIIIGAQRLGQFDLAQKGMQYLRQFWDSESGGFYSSITDISSTTKQDLWVTSGCGQAALYTGHLDIALGVGTWMKRLMELQPNYPQKLYTVYSRSQGLYTNVDKTDPIRYVLVNANDGDQFFFHPGIAAGFLARLYQATLDQQWLTLSIKYMEFAETASDHLLNLLRAGKVAWAASVLYTLTSKETYKNLSEKIGSNIISQQASDGSWHSVGEPNLRNDATAEMVVWLDEIYQATRD